MEDRAVRQPGPVAPERIVFARGSARPVECVLEAGLTLLDAVRRVFADAGCASGVLDIEGGAFGPLHYVMPALSATPDHAAFYSETFRPAGACPLRDGRITFGVRDGAPFLHCHAFWCEADGAAHGGHVLPADSVVAAPIRARAWLLDGMAFETAPDAETNFSLFGPVAHGAAPCDANQGDANQGGAGRKAAGSWFGVRLRPNVDITGALEAFCVDHGIRSATVRGGVGSIVGARFADGRRVEAFATELFIRDGRIAPGPEGTPEAAVDVALVDHLGGLAEGRLQRGRNPVLMTVELVLEATLPGPPAG